MKPRILFAGLFHETHTFLDEVTQWQDFEVMFGQAILGKLGDASPTDGFLEEAVRQGWEVVPTIDARAMPSGIVADEAFERYWKEFETRSRPELAKGVDAIYLVLHGAMVTQSLPDPEGELLARIRALPGAEKVPLFGVLDLHGNISAKMCRHANGLTMYRQNPHTDAKQAALRGAVLLGRCLREKQVPRMAWCRVPVMWAPPGTGTHADPMLGLENFALKMEAEHPDIWAYDVAAGYSFADTPDTGCSLAIITTATDADARRYLQTGAELAWSLRTKGTIEYPSVDEVLTRLKSAPPIQGVTVLVEPSDNIGGAAPGDCTGVLRAFLRHKIDRSLVVINDPRAVEALKGVAPGGRKKLSIGGVGSKLDEGPVDVEVTFVSRSDGNFTLEDRQSHLASMSGVNVVMGLCAVVKTGGTTILLTSKKTPPFDLGQLRSQGIEPRDYAYIGVKAAVAHRRAYDPITAATYNVDTPGPCTGNLASLPWKHLKRPIYPLDPISQPQFQFS
jgi:microcystin degradation protein MlrC